MTGPRKGLALALALPIVLGAVLLVAPEAEAQGPLPRMVMWQKALEGPGWFTGMVGFPQQANCDLSSDGEFWITGTANPALGSGEAARIELLSPYSPNAAFPTVYWDVQVSFGDPGGQAYIHAACDAYYSLAIPIVESPTGAELTDVDGDGHSALEERAGGSHAGHATSTPTTDDDGDGTPNEDEGSIDNIRCSGAYGVVLRWHQQAPGAEDCGGYETPPGCSEYVCVDDEDWLWIWDAFCLGGVTGDYPSCKGAYSNYAVNDSLYDGTFWEDGYGWRNQGDRGIFTQGYDVLLPCEQASEDLDGDDVPTIRVCEATVWLAPIGAPSIDYGPVAHETGDPDDGDANDPVNYAPIMDAYASLTAAATQAIANGTLLVFDQQEEVERALLDFVANATQYYDELPGLAAALLEATAEDAQEAQTCTDAQTASYVTDLGSAATTYGADPSPANLEAFLRVADDGSRQWAAQLQQCWSGFPAFPAVFSLLDFMVDATFDTMNEAIVFANGTSQGGAEQILGVTGNGSAILEAAVRQVADSAIVVLDAYAREAQSLAESVLEGDTAPPTRNEPSGENGTAPSSEEADALGGGFPFELVAFGSVALAVIFVVSRGR